MELNMSDPIDYFPPEVAIRIVTCLSTGDKARCQAVNKKWRKITKENCWNDGADSVSVAVYDCYRKICVNLEQAKDDAATQFHTIGTVTFAYKNPSRKWDRYLFASPRGEEKLQNLLEAVSGFYHIRNIRMVHIPDNSPPNWGFQPVPWLTGHQFGSVARAIDTGVSSSALRSFGTAGCFTRRAETAEFMKNHVHTLKILGLDFQNRHIYNETDLPVLRLRQFRNIQMLKLRMPCGVSPEDLGENLDEDIEQTTRHKTRLSRLRLENLAVLTTDDLSNLLANSSGALTSIHLTVSCRAMIMLNAFFREPAQASRRKLENVMYLVINHGRDITRYGIPSSRENDQEGLELLPFAGSNLPKLEWLLSYRYAGYKLGNHKMIRGDEIITGLEQLFNEQLHPSKQEARERPLCVGFVKTNVLWRADWYGLITRLRNQGLQVEQKTWKKNEEIDPRIRKLQDETKGKQTMKVLQVEKSDVKGYICYPESGMIKEDETVWALSGDDSEEENMDHGISGEEASGEESAAASSTEPEPKSEDERSTHSSSSEPERKEVDRKICRAAVKRGRASLEVRKRSERKWFSKIDAGSQSSSSSDCDDGAWKWQKKTSRKKARIGCHGGGQKDSVSDGKSSST